MVLRKLGTLLRRSVRSPGPGNALDASALTQWVVAVIGVVFVALDIFDAIQIKSEWVIRLLVFSGSALLIASLLNNAEQREERKDNEARLADVTSGQDRVNQELVKVMRQLSAMSSEAEAREVPGSELGQGLTDLLSTSRSWKYRGASGGWLRHRTLPHLANIQFAEVPIQVQILDPRDRDLCTRYASYRRKLRPKTLTRPIDTYDSVLVELLACIYAAWYFGHTTRIQPSISLLPTYSPLRYDVGDSGLYVTIADLNAPGLYARVNGWMYTATVDEFRQVEAELPNVTIPSGSWFPSEREEISAAGVEQALLSAVVTQAGRSSQLLSSDIEVSWDKVTQAVFLDGSSNRAGWR
jgi:hypothetical protein